MTNPYNYQNTGLISAYNLGDVIISPHILEGAAAVNKMLGGNYTLKSDTAFYNLCLKRKEIGAEQTITVGKYSFTGYVYSPDKIYYDISEKPTVDNIYNATGKAFYYGIDTENQRIFLPRLKNVFVGMGDLTDTIRCKGNGMALGYTNGTLKFGTNPINSAGQGSIAAYTSLYKTKVGTVNQQTTQYSNGAIGLDPDSKYSGAVVDGQTITDNAQPAYLYFCVGNALVNTANIDVEKVIGDVRNLEINKADKTEVPGEWQKPATTTYFENLTIQANKNLVLDISAAFPDDGHSYMADVFVQGVASAVSNAVRVIGELSDIATVAAIPYVVLGGIVGIGKARTLTLWCAVQVNQVRVGVNHIWRLGKQS